ncbi:SDR family oxidoreductase [Actinopolymorpha alba]|uniref:SDR family oxidoreductase n=1 Tax=Actinopolymorpha alba TaxID=533267 RepID=UPI00037BF3E7|nr:NAD(P)H-binding protein [Actinopolymorpha alba]
METGILVTGGTGTVGRHVVRRLAAARVADLRVLSRRARPPGEETPARWFVGELVSGEGLEPALAGVGTIIHCAGDARRPSRDIPAVDGLVAAARRSVATIGAPAPHLVVVSIVGIERMPFAYYRIKVAVERLVEASGLPWTILRSTQFHDLIYRLVGGLARLPVVPVPAGVRFQPIDADEVAARLVTLARGTPTGRAADLGGPQVLGFDDLVRGYLHSRGLRRPILRVPVPGAFARSLRAGANLTPDHADGQRTWAAFLAEQAGTGPETGTGAGTGSETEISG